MKTRHLPYTLKWTYHFNHAVEKVWPLVSNTDRMNRAVGMSKVEYRSEASALGGSVRYGKSKVAGFNLEWLENPYEWVINDEFGVHRDYSKGPLKSMDISWTIKPTPTGCQIDQTISFDPLNFIFLIVSYLQIRILTKKAFIGAYKNIQEFLDQNRNSAFATKVDPPPTDKSFYGTVVTQFGEVKVKNDMAIKMAKHIFDSPQAELTRIKPFVLAKAWSLDRLDVLTTFLRGTNRGIFSLSWDIICPRCRGVKSRGTGLNTLKKEIHCDSCNIDFSAQFDKSVEVTFSVHPRIRKVESAEYCVGGPQNTPHFVTQLRMSPHQKIDLSLKLSEGIYRVSSPQSQSSLLLDVKESAKISKTLLDFKKLSSPEERVDVQTGALTLKLSNDEDHEILIVINQVTWMEDVCTAAYVTSLQEFRDRFASEVLDPGQEISVSRVTLLFTDLKGSTKMYQSIGDAKAYKIVRAHFEMLKEAITRHEGAIVKTLGDSVMASFSSPVSALKASLEIRHRLEESKVFEEHSNIKIGIHTGSCFIISSDGKLDYFGTNVNIAARINGQCEAGDIVITQYMMNDPDVQKHLESEKIRFEKITRILKGFESHFDLYQVHSAAKTYSKIG